MAAAEENESGRSDGREAPALLPMSVDENEDGNADDDEDEPAAAALSAAAAALPVMAAQVGVRGSTKAATEARTSSGLLLAV
jgi:hypothetical protein